MVENKWWSRGGSNPWPPHCERVLVGPTDDYTFTPIDINSTKQPSERCSRSKGSYTFTRLALQSRQRDAKNFSDTCSRHSAITHADFKSDGDYITQFYQRYEPVLHA